MSTANETRRNQAKSKKHKREQLNGHAKDDASLKAKSSKKKKKPKKSCQKVMARWC